MTRTSDDVSSGSDTDGDPRSPRRLRLLVDHAYARAVLALLRGQEPTPLEHALGLDPIEGKNAAALAALAATAAHHDDDDTDATDDSTARTKSGADDARWARTVLDAKATFDALPARVARALGLESAPVILPDGSSLTLDDAERLLERKEERAVHRPLRSAVDAAAAPFRQFHDRGSVRTGSDRRAACERFLADTLALRDAARDLLATLGGESLDDPAAVARALDLPAVDGAFSDAITLALLSAMRDGAKPRRPVARFRAPRPLAGAVLDDGDAVRFAHPPGIARFDRHFRTLRGAANAVARAADDGLGATVAAAVTCGVAGAAARRAVGVERGGAERAARIAGAVGLLLARADAAILVAGDDGDEAAREHVSKALGADAGAALLASLRAPPWRATGAPTSTAQVEGAGLASAFREAYDENFALRSEFWQEARAVVADSAANANNADNANKSEEPSLRGARWASGWARWIGELL